VQSAGQVDHGAGSEGLHPQGVEVQLSAYLGVVGVENLETAVETESVDDIGGDSTPDPVGHLQDGDIEPSPGEHPRSDQAGQPGAHDDDVTVGGEGH
jgi:hypothetical protein